MLNLEELTKLENLCELKKIRKENYGDEIEKAFNNDKLITDHLLKVILNSVGICPKITYVAMRTVQPKEMTVKEIRELVNKTYDSKWSDRAVKSFLIRLKTVDLVETKQKNWKTFYSLKLLKID